MIPGTALCPQQAVNCVPAPEKPPAWLLPTGECFAEEPFIVFGVINVTPDSFYDGGLHLDQAKALERIQAMAAAGVHVADIGGESTRPGAAAVSAEEELQRVLPVVQQATALSMAQRAPIALSVDTYKAKVAAACLEAGAVIVNDVSACRFDPALVEVLAQYRPGYVLMHSAGRPETMQQDPRYEDVVDEVLAFLEQRLAFLVRSGVPESHVLLDPGIGFGKRLEHNLGLLRNVERFASLGRPLLLGVSNKSLWGALLQLPLDQRENATQVATALTAARGVWAHRVHEPELTLQTLRVVQAVNFAA